MDKNKQKDKKDILKEIKKMCKENEIGAFLLTDSMMSHIETESGNALTREQVAILKERLIESFYDMYLDYLTALSLDLEEPEV